MARMIFLPEVYKFNASKTENEKEMLVADNIAKKMMLWKKILRPGNK